MKQKENKEARVNEGLFCITPDSVTMLVAPVPLALPVLSHLEITTGVREGYLRVAI